MALSGTLPPFWVPERAIDSSIAGGVGMENDQPIGSRISMYWI